MTIVKEEAILIGANKQPFAVDYSSEHGLSAFGAGNNIALWNPNTFKGVYHTLKKHTKEVTCVRFIPHTNSLVSCGEDSEVNVWERKAEIPILKQTLTGHSGSITCITVLQDLFLTGSSNGEIIVWKYTGGQWTKASEFSVKKGFFPLSLAIQKVRPNQYVIAIGGTLSKLFIYTLEDASESQVNMVAELSGHEDWIKCLEFIQESEDNYLLASGSQDRYIRLWRLRINEKIDDSDEDKSKLILLSNKQYKFQISTTRLAFSFEALIVGHDDWITGLSWDPNFDGTSKHLQLLSSSADTALMIWEMDFESGIWVCVSRLGELSIKGASTATGASGGFWSVNWYIEGEFQYILTNNRTGSIRKFKSPKSDNKIWESVLGVSGPTKGITDIVWSIDQKYIMATSLDQTTRLIAPWNNHRLDNLPPTWHEFARPQIHGYDMICLDNISGTKFVSAGDEKILRVFEMTNSINKILNKFVGTSKGTELPDTAALPVLGLSNKSAKDQLETGDPHADDEEIQVVANTDIFDELDGPPLEDHLQRFTLFPELEKLYGHGYEVTNCVVSPNGKLIATSCKCNSEKHGMIRLFNINEDFQQCSQTLKGHTLTITNIVFSADSKYLLSVSRDRQFILWEVTNEDKGKFELFEINTKAHNRIIWDSTWLPIEYGYYFVTGSRDKQLKLWKVNEQDRKTENISTIKLSSIISSVSSYSKLINGKPIIAVGLENGEIKLVEVGDKGLEIFYSFEGDILSSDKVSRLKFNNEGLLASGSSDSSIRVYDVEF